MPWNILHRHKKTASEAGSSLTTALASPAALEIIGRGNLPCCHGPTDGCDNHNQAHAPTHFDSSLLQTKSKSKAVATPSEDRTPGLPQFWSRLPRDAAALATLPPVHDSVPWTLAYYHIDAIMTPMRSSPPTAPPLAGLYCVGKKGSQPSLSWVVTPLISIDGNLLIEYALAFTVQADLGSWSENDTGFSRAVAKNWLIGSGYRKFECCSHMRRSFKSHKGEGKRGVRYGSVEYAYKQDGGKEVTADWRSEEADKATESIFCSHCYTDSYLSFQMIGNIIICNVQIYKDLGRGESPEDLKWQSLAHGKEANRGKEDFGRMRREFDAYADEVNAGQSERVREGDLLENENTPVHDQTSTGKEQTQDAEKEKQSGGWMPSFGDD